MCLKFLHVLDPYSFENDEFNFFESSRLQPLQPVAQHCYRIGTRSYLSHNDSLFQYFNGIKVTGSFFTAQDHFAKCTLAQNFEEFKIIQRLKEKMTKYKNVN